MSYASVKDLTDRELLTLALGPRVSDDAVGRVQHMLDKYVEIDPFVMKEAGIAPQSIARLDAALELGRRMRATRAAREADTVSTPQDAARLVRALTEHEQREVFHAILLNTKNRFIRVVEISRGSLNASIVHPRELFKEAVRASAASIVVTHNHPSGDPTPSGADIQLTRRLVRAGDVLGIDVMDHVVLGVEPEFASLRELGLM